LPDADETEEIEMSMFTNDPRLAAATAKRDQALLAFNKCPTNADLAKQYRDACYDYWRVIDEIRADRQNKRTK
jgi:hypothetical protein